MDDHHRSLQRRRIQPTARRSRSKIQADILSHAVRQETEHDAALFARTIGFGRLDCPRQRNPFPFCSFGDSSEHRIGSVFLVGADIADIHSHLPDR